MLIMTCLSLFSQHTTLHVHSLQPNTEYRFRISSSNKHGFSIPGEPSDVIVTLERKPSLKIGTVYCSHCSHCHIVIL